MDNNKCVNRVSVVIPVHNGEKTIAHAVSSLLAQKGCELEIILVENYSTDLSTKICKDIEAKDSRVRLVHSFEKGTSIARKIGIIESHGDYIMFCDQDDFFSKKTAIKEICYLMIKYSLDICQFGYKISYFPGLEKRIGKKWGDSIKPIIYDRNQLYKKQIKGALGFGWDKDIYLDTKVWNKCYRAHVLKSIQDNIDKSLYFAEDVYLNTYAFFSSETQTIGITNQCFYTWTAGSGFSSTKESGLALLKDLDIQKSIAIKMIKQNNLNIKIEHACYWNSLNIFRWYLYGLIRDEVDKNTVKNLIDEIGSLKFIRDAKLALRRSNDTHGMDIEDFRFLISDYSAEEMYRWCNNTLPKESLREYITHKTAKLFVKIRIAIIGY